MQAMPRQYNSRYQPPPVPYMPPNGMLPPPGPMGSYSANPFSNAQFPQTLNFAMLTTFLSQAYLYDSAKWFLFGTVLTVLQNFWYWLKDRFSLRYELTASFSQGDPAYDWLILYLTEKNIWKTSRTFYVSAKSSKRQWGVVNGGSQTPGTKTVGSAEYVPGFSGTPHVFRFKGCVIDVNKNTSFGGGTSLNMASITLSLYTLDMNVLSDLVEEARMRYIEKNSLNVIVHTSQDNGNFGGPGADWNYTKCKNRRPLESLILEAGVLDSLLKDARDFLNMEEWYVKAGIPHHRGYLLYGPPGTGKTSTIYAFAGELGLEIYSLSLASGNIDDAALQRATSTIPKGSILLIEDIDCAFRSREEWDEEEEFGRNPMSSFSPIYPGRRASVTMSGLLNVLDGVGSEEGKIFFATTNYVDRIDPAMMRPGRIDKKIEYHLATKYQARALFNRFYPEELLRASSSDCGTESTTQDETESLKSPMLVASETLSRSNLEELASIFEAAIPNHEFSVAELQGYLLGWKLDPQGAAEGAKDWVEDLQREKVDKNARDDERKQKKKEVRENAMRAPPAPVVVQLADGNALPQVQPALPAGKPSTQTDESDGHTSCIVPASPTPPQVDDFSVVDGSASVSRSCTCDCHT